MTLKVDLILIGFQNSGKTTLGREFSFSLKCPFIDTDHLINAYHPSLNCRQIFEQEGEDYFRQLEQQVISSLLFNPPFIIATGGGSLLQLKNAETFKANGKLIYLKTSKEVLLKRIESQPGFPAYLKNSNWKENFEFLYQKRTKLYEKWADYTIEMDHLTIEQAHHQLSLLI